MSPFDRVLFVRPSGKKIPSGKESWQHCTTSIRLPAQVNVPFTSKTFTVAPYSVNIDDFSLCASTNLRMEFNAVPSKRILGFTLTAVLRLHGVALA
jgi:hypothetical protein